MSTLEPPRTASPSIGTREHYRWLEWVVRAALVLNLLDALFTLVWVGSGVAEEANPLLAELVTERPVLFVVTKLTLVGGASWLLWRHRDRPLAVAAIFLSFGVYYAILVHHLGYLGFVLGDLLSDWQGFPPYP
ncbi:MAG: DUF5658 family protein [Myxococcota bacterium]|nr:DUF5658 family protein [Myxococcota bacterium]